MEYFYRQYLSTQPEMSKIGAVYPGFHDFYAEGGWGDGFFFIDHKSGQTLDEMIQMAIQYEDKGTLKRLFNPFCRVSDNICVTVLIKSNFKINLLSLVSLRVPNSIHKIHLVNMHQLITWNDYGEGTIFEPTRETGFDYLVALSPLTGGSSNPNDYLTILIKYLTSKCK